MKFEDLAPVLAIAVFAVVIIVKQLLSHQRQMTELLHRVNQQQPTQESLKMQQDMLDLKQLVHQQSITIDNLSNQIGALSGSNGIHQRMTSNGN